MSAFYRDTAVNNKSVHEYSIKVNNEQWLGASSMQGLIDIVLDEGIDPSAMLYIDGEPSSETVFDNIVE